MIMLLLWQGPHPALSRRERVQYGVRKALSLRERVG
jgi:hypothetical protein